METRLRSRHRKITDREQAETGKPQFLLKICLYL